MSRTYIGPFGRILPVPDDKEPERQQLPVDETRTNMTTYQLPPPEQLHFGSDTSPGFTEPMRYNTISQSSRSYGSSNSMYSEHSRQIGHEQLPPLRQLLTPATQSNVPTSPFSPQHSQNPPQRQPILPSDHRGPLLDRKVRASQHPHQLDYPQPQIPMQVQPLASMSSLRENFQIGPTVQQFPSSYIQHQVPSMSPYAPSIQTTQSMSYPPLHQQDVPLDPSQPQQISISDTQLQHTLPVNPTHPQQMLPVHDSTPYYQEQPSNYQVASEPAMSSELTPPAIANNVKPLPRVVGERIIPGEGPSWVYEDGTTCKKVIDGEMVNAQWGVTKAGKPRKRLAIACTTCREKKIKCDPAEPKCVQCEKFGRECRFTTAFRNQHGSPDLPSYDSQTRPPFINIKSEISPYQSKVSLIVRSSSTEDQNVFTTLKPREPSPKASHIKTSLKGDIGRPLSKAISAKKQRFCLPKSRASTTESKNRSLKTSGDVSNSQFPVSPWKIEPEKLDMHSFSWSNDPYEINADITIHYLDAYFLHINSATYRMFPRKPFLRWAQNSHQKSADELMTVYALLSVGSVFSSRPERNHEGALFAKIAKYAVEKSQGKFSLQLTHSRLLLALYHFSLGEAQKAWDYGGFAIRAASGLGLNLEIVCQDVRDGEELVYGLGKHALAECRRRAFWSAYMTDRFSGTSSGYMCMLQNEDTYLRLPCAENSYEDQEEVDTPYFNNGLVDQQLCEVIEPSKLGSMAFSVEILSIWGDILGHVFRSSHWADKRYLAGFDAFYATTHERLLSWIQRLPSHLMYNESNIASCIAHGDIGSLISIHTVYHAAFIKMNRSMRHAVLPASIAARNIKEALRHARKVLQMIWKIETTTFGSQASYRIGDDQQHSADLAFSTPFVGYAILTAVDILSAGGSLELFAATVMLCEDVLIVFDRLGQFWASARVQGKLIKRRMDRLVESVHSKTAEEKSAWKFKEPLDTSFGKDQDVFYDNNEASRKTFFGHLETKVVEEEILVVD